MTVTSLIIDSSLDQLLDVSSQTQSDALNLLRLTHPTSETDDPVDSELLHSAIPKTQKTLISHLARLRGSNRSAILALRDTKHATAEARQEVDRLHLQLQNLYYEQRHLRGEIAACESYDHKYQQLPLVAVEDFLERFPKHAADDENTLMVARIAHEHTEREALEHARQGLLKKKQSLIADNKKRRDDLANLDQDLEKFIDAAKPIQKIFEKEI
ncbi:hypothetical protein MMC25_000107 [Agyrium rufum]|nr:hypothetical protein [Agyrium rufum]